MGEQFGLFWAVSQLVYIFIADGSKIIAIG